MGHPVRTLLRLERREQLLKRSHGTNTLPFEAGVLYGKRKLTGFQLLIKTCFAAALFQGVDPAVTHAIRELLFLTPRRARRQVGFKTFTRDMFPFAVAAALFCPAG